jgi:hypothetical protein
LPPLGFFFLAPGQFHFGAFGVEISSFLVQFYRFYVLSLDGYRAHHFVKLAGVSGTVVVEVLSENIVRVEVF